MPWVPLASSDRPPETVFRECRSVIDQVTQPHARANLLAVTQVLSRLRYNDPRLLAILGGQGTMVKSPLIRELVAEQKHEDILGFLEERFGPIPRDVSDPLRRVEDRKRLMDLVRFAARCSDLDSFRQRLES